MIVSLVFMGSRVTKSLSAYLGQNRCPFTLFKKAFDEADLAPYTPTSRPGLPGGVFVSRTSRGHTALTHP
jgi:hypothetical protein